MRHALELERFAAKGLEELIRSKKIEGLSVSRGLYAGPVKIVTDFSAFDTVRPGEVLVTPMTRPHFNESIRRAGAIVTDEGAVLCHAAIIAREAHIPCIVGTKIATKVLKNGDMVEVDAEKGIVRKL
jgi:pyruvate,water dikinase